MQYTGSGMVGLRKARIEAGVPAVVLAPMDGVTDAPMREYLGTCGSFSFCVSEFVRVSQEVLPPKAFRHAVPELLSGGTTRSGLPVQVQLLGGDAGRMAGSAESALRAGATSIDINFGCPAPVVNRHDGGASLLRSPCRIREVVQAVRSAVPEDVPVSAKLRLGWDSIDDVHCNVEAAVEGGATWITLHARTRTQGYRPPVFWSHVGAVREKSPVPVVVNGDIWSESDFVRCREASGCEHYMIGRGALGNPALATAIARALGNLVEGWEWRSWGILFRGYLAVMGVEGDIGPIGRHGLFRLKQWIRIANTCGNFPYFDALKRSESLCEFFDILDALEATSNPETLVDSTAPI